MTEADELADRLAAVAVELTQRVRDDPAAEVHAWLRAQLPDSLDWFRLCIILAAVVPDDRSWTSLKAWTLKPVQRRAAPVRSARELQPCGTPAAAARHRYRKEDLCEDCRDAVRAHDRDRKRRRRAS